MKRYLPFVFALLLLFVIAYYFGFEKIFIAFKGFNFIYLFPIALLTYFEFYLQTIRFRLIASKKYKLNNVLKNYAIGAAVAFVFPSRALGELARIFSFSKLFKIKFADASGIVSIERIIDVIVLLIFSSFFVLFFKDKKIYYLIIFFFIVIVILLLFMLNKAFRNIFLSIIAKIFGKKKIFSFFYDYSSTGKNLLDFRIFFYAFFITVVLWIFDVLRLVIVFKAFSFSLNFFLIASLVALSYLASVLFFLPGGIGIFEAGIPFVLKSFFVPVAISFSAVFIERIFSYWIWIFIGFYFLNKHIIRGLDNLDKSSSV